MIDPDDDSDDAFRLSLWAALDVPDPPQSPSKLVPFFDRFATSYNKWDALHHDLPLFSHKMVSCFRSIRPLLAEYFHCAPLPPSILFLIVHTHACLVSPIEGRQVVTDYLLEMGRWIQTAFPAIALGSIRVLRDALVQSHVTTVGKRSWELQRWASVVAAAALATEKSEASVKEASEFFDVVHEAIWELIAIASTKVTEMSPERCAYEKDAQLPPAHATLGLLVPFGMSDTADFLAEERTDTALAADYAPTGTMASSALPRWHATGVWHALDHGKIRDVKGVELTQQLHALVISLTLLSRKCTNLRERGIVCLANLVRTLNRSPHTGASLISSATMCMKLLRYPAMQGTETMPLSALLRSTIAVGSKR